MTLSSISLQDREYYHFVSDGIQQLCDKAGMYPCVLDAAIFLSFDNGEWTIENSIFKNLSTVNSSSNYMRGFTHYVRETASLSW